MLYFNLSVLEICGVTFLPFLGIISNNLLYIKMHWFLEGEGVVGIQGKIASVSSLRYCELKVLWIEEMEVRFQWDWELCRVRTQSHKYSPRLAQKFWGGNGIVAWVDIWVTNILMIISERFTMYQTLDWEITHTLLKQFRMVLITFCLWEEEIKA